MDFEPVRIPVVLNSRAHTFLSAVDLGLSRPSLPPGPDNPPLRDQLTMFCTYASDHGTLTRLFLIFSFIATLQMDAGVDSGWVDFARNFPDITHPYAQGVSEQTHPAEYAYFRAFGIEPSPDLVRTKRDFPWGNRAGDVARLFAYDKVRDIVAIMASEVPHPCFGQTLDELIGQDSGVVGRALRDYGDNALVYLVDGTSLRSGRRQEACTTS